MIHLELAQQLLFRGQGILMIKRICYILLFSFLVAGTDGTIRGKIISANDGQPLTGVQIFIISEIRWVMNLFFQFPSLSYQTHPYIRATALCVFVWI